MSFDKETFDRLKKIIEEDEFFTVPSGLSREERRAFLRDCAEGKIEPDEKKPK